MCVHLTRLHEHVHVRVRVHVHVHVICLHMLLSPLGAKTKAVRLSMPVPLPSLAATHSAQAKQAEV